MNIKSTTLTVILFAMSFVASCKGQSNSKETSQVSQQPAIEQNIKSPAQTQPVEKNEDIIITSAEKSYLLPEYDKEFNGISFKAQMPAASQGSPDFGVPLLWFSADYVNEVDRLAFAVRGGKLQSLTVYDYKQRLDPSPQAPSRAHSDRFWRLPENIRQGQWFDVELRFEGNLVVLAIDGKVLCSYPRELQNKASFALGGSWQVNKFKDIKYLKNSTLSCVSDEFAPRQQYHHNAIKIDFGPADVEPQQGWKRVTEALSKLSTDQAGWTSITAGSRKRTALTSQQRLSTIIALAHAQYSSGFTMPLESGDYIVTVGYGDAQYGSIARITSPDGTGYQSSASAGQFGEFRFKVSHSGGLLEIPMRGSGSKGMSVCYLVVEPDDGLDSVALSKPAVKDDSKVAAMEPVRKNQRARYKAVKLPALKTKSTFETSLAGNWLFMPVGQGFDVTEAVSPDHADSNWHVIDVPTFWNETGWWIYGQGARHVSHRLIFDELKRTDSYTFNPRNLRTACYRQWLDVPPDWGGRKVQLEFDAVASVCAVYLNGEQAFVNRGMFKPFVVDVSEFIKAGSDNLIALWVNNGIADDKADSADDSKQEVAVTMVVTPDMVTGLPRAIYSSPVGENGKRLVDRQGGIWQDVRIRVSTEVVIEDVWPVTSLDALTLSVTAKGDESFLAGAEVQVVLRDAESTLIKSSMPWKSELKEGSHVMKLDFDGLSPKLWSPGQPRLYDMKVKLSKNSKVLDLKSQKVGFRTFEVVGNKFYLNGKPFRWIGSNMGPFGLAPNDKALAKEYTRLMKEGNQNATRSVCSPYPKVWLDESDAQGVAVSLEGTWSWLMHANMEIPQESSLEAWKQEWYALIRQLRGHPSIVMWTVNNETYMSHDENYERRTKKLEIVNEVIAEMRRLDPTRPIVFWSGYSRKREDANLKHVGIDINADDCWLDDGDVDDIHFYAGTYQGSWFGNFKQHSDWYDSFTLPDRPLISQEAATAYTDTDTGHQETSYIQSWHALIWLGNSVYEHRNPQRFLDRQAFITKQQVEMLRRKDFAGQKLSLDLFLRNDDIKQRDFDLITVDFSLKDKTGKGGCSS